MKITRTSVVSGVERTRDVPVDPRDLMAWQAGTGSIQMVMPYLSDSDREFILSGIVDSEWEEAFREEDEDHVNQGFETVIMDEL